MTTAADRLAIAAVWAERADRLASRLFCGNVLEAPR